MRKSIGTTQRQTRSAASSIRSWPNCRAVQAAILLCDLHGLTHARRPRQSAARRARSPGDWPAPESSSATGSTVAVLRRLLDSPGVLPGVATEAVTDADGRFRLQGLGRERLASLNIRGPGIADTSIVVMTREAADVHTRPQGATKDLVTYGAGSRARTRTGPERDGRGARQGVRGAASECLGRPRDQGNRRA